MTEIWTKFVRFKTIKLRLAEQIGIVKKNSWFSDLEILEIQQQIYRQAHKERLYHSTQDNKCRKAKDS